MNPVTSAAPEMRTCRKCWAWSLDYLASADGKMNGVCREMGAQPMAPAERDIERLLILSSGEFAQR